MKNEIQRCSCCGQKISIRRKRIDRSMVSALIRAFEHVMQHNKQTFQIAEVKFTPIEYGIVNNLVRFGLLYKSE
jgi:hypothetical protein